MVGHESALSMSPLVIMMDLLPYRGGLYSVIELVISALTSAGMRLMIWNPYLEASAPVLDLVTNRWLARAPRLVRHTHEVIWTLRHASRRCLDGPVVLYVNSYKSAIAALAVRVGNPDARIIYHVHGGVDKGGLTLAQRIALRRADCTVAVSEHVAAAIRCHSSRTEVIPNPISASFVRRISSASTDKYLVREQLGIPDEALVFGTVGRCTEQKGFHVLARAFQEVLHSGSQYGRPIYLVLVGLSPASDHDCYSEEIRRLVRELGISGRTILVDYCSDVVPFLAAMDVFVMPSIQAKGLPTEGFGLAALEAMTAGCAIIASGVGGLPELLQNGRLGILVKQGDTGGLSEAMARLAVDDALRLRLSEECSTQVIDTYGEVSFRKAVVAVVESVI